MSASRVVERDHQQSQAKSLYEEVCLECKAVVRSSPPRQPLCRAMWATATDQPCSMMLPSFGQESPVQLLPSPPVTTTSCPAEDARAVVPKGCGIFSPSGGAVLSVNIVSVVTGRNGSPCRHPISEIIPGGVRLDVLGESLAARLALRSTPLSSVASEPDAPQVRWKGANDGQVGSTVVLAMQATPPTTPT